MSQGPPTARDRYIGCLVGMAIGDALAIPFAGLTRDQVQARQDEVGTYVALMSADGEKQLDAAQFGPEIELTVCIAEGLVTSNGFVDPEIIGPRFLHVAEGPQAHLLDKCTRDALAVADENDDFQAGSCSTADAGPLSRAVPIAMTHALSAMNAELLVREVMRAMLITHSHPDTINGGLAVAYAVRLALQRELPPSMVASEVLSFIDEDMTARMVRRVKNRLEAGDMDIEQTLPALLSGESLADSVAAALYIFGATDGDFDAGVRAAAALGGEVWNAGALVGALAGAYGGGSAIPAHLVDGLESRMYLLMAAPALLRVAQLRGGIFLQLERQ